MNGASNIVPCLEALFRFSHAPSSYLPMKLHISISPLASYRLCRSHPTSPAGSPVRPRERVPSRPGRRSRCRTARLPPTARRIMRSVNDGVVRTTRPPPIARRIVCSVNDGVVRTLPHSPRPPPTAPGESCAPPNRRNKLRQWRLRAPPLPACTDARSHPPPPAPEPPPLTLCAHEEE